MSQPRSGGPQETSLRTRRQSNAARPSKGPGAPPPFPTSLQQRPSDRSTGSNRSGGSGPPPSSSNRNMAGAGAGGGQGGGETRARLLKKRQSVSYHVAMEGGAGMHMGGGPIPGVPSLPSVIPPPMPVGPGGQPLPGVRGGSRAPSPSPSMDALIADPDSQLSKAGVDVEALASEAFKPEDCEPPLCDRSKYRGLTWTWRQQQSSSRTCRGGQGESASQMEDLRRLRTKLENAMKITETDLQRSVFK